MTLPEDAALPWFLPAGWMVWLLGLPRKGGTAAGGTADTEAAAPPGCLRSRQPGLGCGCGEGVAAAICTGWGATGAPCGRDGATTANEYILAPQLLVPLRIRPGSNLK